MDPEHTIMTRPPRQARCPVCGVDLPASPWRCQRCDTPHHADCAEYFGGCAIFGCRDGHPPARLEMQQWPEAVSALQSLGRCRTVQDVLMLTCLCSFALMLLQASVFSGLSQLLSGPLVLGFLASFGAYAVLDALWAETRWKELQALLALENRRALQVERHRLRSVLPSTMKRFGLMLRLGQMLFALGPIAGLALHSSNPVEPVLLALVVSFPGALLWAAAHQLGVHRAQLEQFRNRLEATYAPALPEKPKPPE
jgi:hypothetical protein